jgi:hypothetical protein
MTGAKMNKLSRRDFLVSLPRWLIAGTLGGGAFLLLKRNNEKCTSSKQYCKKCSRNDSCGLPSALSYRRNAK